MSAERYATAKHEAIHALAALAYGHGVVAIDIDQGQTLLQWEIFPFEIPKLMQRDADYAAELVSGAIIACIAPSVHEREPVNAGDFAAMAKFQRYWPRSEPLTWERLCHVARAEASAWLRQRDTITHILRLSQDLFVHRQLEGPHLQRILRKITAPPAPAPSTPPHPPDASVRQPTRDPLDVQAEWVLQDYHHLQRSLYHAYENRVRYSRNHTRPRFPVVATTR